jgi:CheY-like chemotaxis protein
MSKQVLWLDNDVAYITPYKNALEDLGFTVTVVRSVGEAEFRLKNGPYELMILDVMVPTRDQEEEKGYPPTETDYGHKTGLVFYLHKREELKDSSTRVFVFTVRLDESVKDEFLAAGLPLSNFATKFALRDVNNFLKKMQAILAKEPDK